MRATLPLALALLALPALAPAQPRAPDPSREALRETLLVQAREARRREDWGACTSYLDAATAIRADVLVRYGSALCAFEAGLFPEARRFAVACLAEQVGDPALHDQCRAVLAQLDALEREPATPATPPREPPAPAPGPVTVRNAPTPHPVPRAPRPSVPAGAVALWAVGGASLAVAAVGLGLWASSTSACAVSGDRAVCPTRADADRAADAGTWATVANTAFPVGLAAVAGGVAWWLVDRARGGAPADTHAPHVVAGIGPGSATVAVTF